MADHKSDLYRWERFSKPRVYSRSQKITSNDDIQDWIKKVEDASNKAAAATFGTKYTAPRSHGKASALATVEDLHQHNAAYAEAQELLQQWMTEKVDLDSGLDFNEDEEDTWSPPRKTQAEIKREWDHLVEGDDINFDIDLESLGSNRHTIPRQDPYAILREDEDNIVDEILGNMMEKDVIRDDFKKDLGLDGTRKEKDPRMKMQLRQQQVKENRERRLKELEKKRREQQACKEAAFNARQIIKKEEQMKVSQAKKEEQEIQKEMARIRKEMAEERRRQEENRIREKQEKEELQRKAQEEYERQIAAEAMERQQQRQTEEGRRRRIVEKLELVQARQVKENLKLLHRCFTAWYDIIVDKRLKMGKARAMADWKLTLRCWNAWRSYTRSQRLDEETRRHEQDLREMQRKQTMATSHHRLWLLRRCFLAWRVYINQSHQQRELMKEKSQTRNKMAAFLEAAATGKLWQGEDDDTQNLKSVENVTVSTDSTQQRVDDLFSEPFKQQRGSASARSDLSSLNSDRSQRSNAKVRGVPKPSDAWQVNKKQTSQVKNPTQDDEDGSGDARMYSGRSDNSSKSATSPKKTPKQPWEKMPFIASNFEHRHAAQQQILETQQKQLKEQQRLIEELQYLQRQQLLQQQVTQQQLMSNGIVVPETSQTANNAALQKHIDNLKKDLAATEKEGADYSQRGRIQSAGSETVRSESTTALDTFRTERTNLSSASSSAVSRTTSRVSMPENSRHIKFRQAMEERAAERARLKREREEKRRKAEEEKLAQLQAEEEERLRQEEEEKKRRIEAHREKKRLEKQRELERQKEQERLKELHQRAAHHHELALMKFRGWKPWQQLVVIAREKRRRAEEHYYQTLMRKCLIFWRTEVKTELDEKKRLADELHNYLVVRRCFNNWKKVGESVAIQEEKARRFFERNLMLKIVRAWFDYTKKKKVPTATLR